MGVPGQGPKCDILVVFPEEFVLVAVNANTSERNEKLFCHKKTQAKTSDTKNKRHKVSIVKTVQGVVAAILK